MCHPIISELHISGAADNLEFQILPFILFPSALSSLCHVWCGWEAGLWASWASAQNCCYISAFMVSAFIQKLGKAVALLPVQNLGGSQGNCALLKGVCVFSVKHLQNIGGWEPSRWNGLCWAWGCILSPKTSVLQMLGFVGWIFWLCWVQLYLGAVSTKIRLSEHLMQVNKLGRGPALGVWFLHSAFSSSALLGQLCPTVLAFFHLPQAGHWSRELSFSSHMPSVYLQIPL